LLAKRRRLDEYPAGQGGANPVDEARRRIREISPRDLGKFTELPLIVDVRGQDEFFSGHIKGAKNVRGDFSEMAVFEIAPDRARPILVYCAAGNRGALAADNLQKMGYLNVFSLRGGLSSWLEAGGVVETSSTV